MESALVLAAICQDVLYWRQEGKRGSGALNLLYSMCPVAPSNKDLFLVITLVSFGRLEAAIEPCPTPCHCTLEILNCSGTTNPPGLHRVPFPKPYGHPHVFFFLILNHNPLTALDDPYFYKLPSLKFLDLGATEIVPKVVVDILNTSIWLKTLILPRKMSCCLCRIQDDIEVLCETVKLDCTETCDVNTTLCDQEEALNKMQNEIMKLLETRKRNTSSTLTILPEKPLQDNSTLALTVTQGLSHFGIHFQNLTPHLLITVNQLSNLKADDFMDVKWADKSELKKLYILAKLLQAALKEKIAEYENESQRTGEQKETSAQVSDQSEAPLMRVKRYQEEVKRGNWFGKIPSMGESSLGWGTEFPKAVMQQDAEQQISLDLHRGAQPRQRKLSWELEHESMASLLRHQRAAAFPPAGKRSMREAATGAPSLTASIVVDDDAADDLTGKVVIILKHSNKSRKPTNEAFQIPIRKQEEEASGSQHDLSESQPGRCSDIPNRECSEDFMPGNKLDSQKDQELHRLMHKGEKSQMPAEDTEMLNELSPDISLSQETRWEHHEQSTSASPQATFLPSEDDYLLQSDLFEAEVNKRLEPLIPNMPVRNLISHVIRILKMDCSKPTIKMACVKLISRTGLLMKLFSERENLKETSSFLKSYLGPLKGNLSTANQRNEGKPSDELSRQGMPKYGYNNKLFLAISVTVAIMVIIAVICLTEICSQRSAAKAREGTAEEKRSFLGRRKKSTPERQVGCTINGKAVVDSSSSLAV
nr:uncharacterized protein LOC110073885 [Pogona vitticeps]